MLGRLSLLTRGFYQHSSSLYLTRRAFATRKYTPDHEWVSIDKNTVVMGITEYAQNALGDVVYLEIPTVGKIVSKKDQLGAVESVKAASDIYAPVSGKIIQVNKDLEDEPSLVNSSPYEKGWIAKIELSKPEELNDLLDETAYAKHTSQ